MNFIKTLKAMGKREAIIIGDDKDAKWVIINIDELNKLNLAVEKIAEEKKTLSDWIISQYGFENDMLLVTKVKETIKDLMVWVTTKHAPEKDSIVVFEVFKKIVGKRLI